MQRLASERSAGDRERRDVVMSPESSKPNVPGEPGSAGADAKLEEVVVTSTIDTYAERMTAIGSKTPVDVKEVPAPIQTLNEDQLSAGRELADTDRLQLQRCEGDRFGRRQSR